ncbi:hypothetical protein AKJ08_0160 [Vulgatibacter incomptus]|uniref:Uncharacterized protein n=1 Tax=Vulgatibacter incomptus TaxID=1391653 RepID=A0A0K1P8C1_9BACT|nr:hypothetical protein AKJ08_0160 [Vulgatibacter incomptus]
MTNPEPSERRPIRAADPFDRAAPRLTCGAATLFFIAFP